MFSSPGNSKNKTGGDINTCKQRFKGVETFLRRIAFNLGNSPSQTEVKIISCIPIDVTDLQNKIISLERQLFEATNDKASTKHTNLIEPAIQNTSAVLSCKCSEVKSLGLGDTSRIPSISDDGSSKTRKSTVSFLFPTLSKNRFTQNQPFMSTKNWIDKESVDASIEGHRKRFFRRSKKKNSFKKEKRKPQLVYYAQTVKNPFVNYGMSTDFPFLDCSKRNDDNVFNKSYLANVIQRHFDPERVVEEFSDTSHFTSPVCRDSHNHSHCSFESDVCSCCHGHFQDVDKYIDKNLNFIIGPNPTHVRTEFNKGIYYDSNLYDIVPVREKSVKVPKTEKFPTRESKHPEDIRCWPESARNKSRHKATAIHKLTKMHTKSNYNKPKCHLQNAKNNIITKSPKHYRENKVDKRTGPTDASKSFCIYCSEIYPKPMFATHKNEKPVKEPTRTILKKNAECLTIDVDTKNLTINRSIQIDINSTETRTEETLSQIKSILQSVLAEVKTNPQLKHLLELKMTKDVAIEKGPCQSNIQTHSTLLHSFTYNNSCNTNPYLPTCSRQIASPPCYTNVPYKRPNCTHDFPLLIQTPGYQKCGCFYKSSSQKSTPAQKEAANRATNTEIENKKTQDGETEKLIKEIYKSIALTMDFQKETSNSEYDERKSVTNNYSGASDPKNLRSIIIAMSDAPKRDIQIETSMTPLSSTPVRSNYNSSLIAAELDAKRKEDEYYLNYESQSIEHEVLDTEEPNRGKANVASTITEHYSEEISTDDKSEEDKIEKKGLLKRIIGSVKLFNKKKQTEIKENKKQDWTHKEGHEKLQSDSDDYQTIYSEKINRPEQFNRNSPNKQRNYATYRPVQEIKSRLKSNRRSPYMEQEYRRQWNEQLMFQENRGRKYSSDRPYSYRQSPVYCQNYEVKSAMVDHRVPCQAAYNSINNAPIKTVIQKVDQRTSPLNILDRKEAKSKFNWLKKTNWEYHNVESSGKSSY